MKSWVKSRTIWFNVLALFVTVISAPEFANLVPDSWMPIILQVVAVGNVLLRLDTDAPVTARSKASK